MRVPPSVPVIPALDGVVVTAAGVEAFDCPVCEGPRDLVVPVCGDDDRCGDDDHADGCPDRACAECGFALVVGSLHAPVAVGSLESRRAG